MKDSNSAQINIKLENSLESFTMGNLGVGNMGFMGMSPVNGFYSETIAQPWTFAFGAAYTPFTLNRVNISYGYMSYGLVQSLIDLPVEDAFRGNFDIVSDQLSPKETKKVMDALMANGDIEALKQAWKWTRLFGGGGLIINANGDYESPFNAESVTKGSALEFIAADRWELLLEGVSLSGFHTNSSENFFKYIGIQNVNKFNYYGHNVDPSRVMVMMGKAAPSFVRPRLQGWGMSELERCVRSINSFIKFQNMIFELIDEAKIDIFKIENFNMALMTAFGTENIQKRVQLASMLKNYKRTLTMDKNDDYEQKQIHFSGLAEIFNEVRLNVASDIRFPMNKLFGLSAGGFGSGEDSIENYNTIVESDVRAPITPHLKKVVSLRMRNVIGKEVPFDIEWPSLRLMDAETEEIVNTHKHQRIMERFQAGLLNGQEAEQAFQKQGISILESEVARGKEPGFPIGRSFDMGGMAQMKGGEGSRGLPSRSEKRRRDTPRTRRKD